MSPGRTQWNPRGAGQFRVMRAGDLSLGNIGGLTFSGVLDQEGQVLVFFRLFLIFLRKTKNASERTGQCLIQGLTFGCTPWFYFRNN